MTTPTTKRVTATASAQPAFKAVNTDMEDVLAASRQAAARPAQATPAKAVAEISGNPFYKIMFDPGLSLDEKRQAMAQSLVYDKALSEEQNAQRLDAFVHFS